MRGARERGILWHQPQTCCLRAPPPCMQDAAGTPQPSPRGPTGRDAIGGDLLLSAMAALHFPLNFAAARSMGIHGQVRSVHALAAEVQSRRHLQACSEVAPAQLNLTL